jgi:pyruvate dehydrogenase E2 component (dihydrolipoamide acetyltransferase)
MKDILMPSFGADMGKGEVAQWKVKSGDKVKNGDIIASIETMKGLIDMEVFDDGVIEQLLVEEGQELKVGQLIAKIRLSTEPEAEVSEDRVPENNTPEVKTSKDKAPNDRKNWLEEPPASAAGKQPALEKYSPSTVLPKGATTYAIKHRGEEITRPILQQRRRKKISPLALKTAQQSGLDWQQITQGSGSDGAIVLADIMALKQVGSSQEAGSDQTLVTAKDALSEKSNAAYDMRQAIGAVVSQSKREIPHYYLQLDMVLDKAQLWLTQHNQGLAADELILINAVIYVAIARALQRFPAFNGFYHNAKFEPAGAVHLGNAISLHQGGLVVAALHNAQQLSCTEMMIALKDQVIRAREGGLRMSEMLDATVTVSNLGNRGVDNIQSIIFPPQVAIIGIGRPRTIPWVVEQQLGVATVVSVSLAADHRVSDGHSGARLLNKINKLLQKPESLL